MSKKYRTNWGYYYETIQSVSSLDFVQAIEKQWHPLFVAATSSTPNLCSHIIQKAGVVKDPRLVNLTSGRNKMTPIVFTADFMGDVNVFELLLKNAEDKNPILSTINNWTLFHSLADKGDFQMCRSMVETVQDLSPRDIHGRTPCHIAALNGHEEVCYILMMHLTAINPKDNSGQTPLHLAASYGHLKVCRLLVETAKACMEENEMDDFLRIPLHVAAFNGHVEVVKLFMTNLGENEEQKTPFLSFKTEDLLLFNSSIPVQFFQSRKLHQTLLLNAIQGGSLNVIELLVDKYKLDVNHTDDFGMTPLNLASKLGKLEICKFLSKYVLDKNTLDNDAKIYELQAKNKQILESDKELQPGNVNINQGEIQNSLNVEKMLDSKLSALENEMNDCITDQTSSKSANLHKSANPGKASKVGKPGKTGSGIYIPGTASWAKRKEKESLERSKEKEKEDPKDLPFVVSDKDKPEVKRIEWCPAEWQTQNYKPRFKKTAKMERKEQMVFRKQMYVDFTSL